ncbi:MAG: hypothetical protein LBQ27_04840 [Clostridiales bacterium]|jgi:hypothetical protein|nr:hypothetical protein [Clostridiales bacterium]
MKAKRINFKKLLLFIVEGSTDKIALENILKKIFSDKKICFKTIYGDVTSEEETTVENIDGKIAAYVKDFLTRNIAFKKTDIMEIIHLTDLDGVFLSDRRIIYDKDADIFYDNKHIRTGKSFKIIERNRRKSEVLKHLSSVNSIKGVNYSIYFFGANMEHVFCNSANCTDGEKESCAYGFAQSFKGREKEFPVFLKEQKVVRNWTYEESWKFVESGVNSLKRLTNINVLLEKFK